MRNFLCLAAAFALSTAVAAPPTADACGGSYGAVVRTPRSFAVSTHFVRDVKGRRGFVALGGTAPTGLAWKQLAPRTYDATQIAPAPARAPMTLTLVGEQGTRVVTSARYVYLSQSMFLPGSTLALEFDVQPGEDFEIALLGTRTDAKWSDLPERRVGSKADATWLHARGFVIEKAELVSVYDAGDVEVLSIWDAKTQRTMSLFRRGMVELGRSLGHPRGTVIVDGTRYVAIANQREVSLVTL